MKYILVFAAVFLFCTGSMALDIPPHCPQTLDDEESSIALAKIWFGKGTRFVDSEEYGEAVDAFLCSLRMVEHQSTMFNAARAALLAEKYSVAAELADIIIANAEDKKAKAKGKRILAEARSNMAKPSGPESEVEEYVESPEIDPEEETHESEVIPEEQVVREKPAPLRVAGIATTVTGAATLVVRGVLQGLAGSAQKTTGETRSYDDYVSARDSIKGYQTGATASFIAGGVLLGAGIAMIAVERKRGEQLKVSITPTLRGISLGGTF